MGRRQYDFSINAKQVLNLARSNNLNIKDIRIAERILKNVSEYVMQKIDGVILKEIESVLKEPEPEKVSDTKAEILKAEEIIKAAEEITEDLIDESIEEIVEEEAVEEKPKAEVHKCPVCGRGCKSKSRLQKHINNQAKTDYKHKEYVASIK